MLRLWLSSSGGRRLPLAAATVAGGGARRRSLHHHHHLHRSTSPAGENLHLELSAGAASARRWYRASVGTAAVAEDDSIPPAPPAPPGSVKTSSPPPSQQPHRGDGGDHGDGDGGVAASYTTEEEEAVVEAVGEYLYEADKPVRVRDIGPALREDVYALLERVPLKPTLLNYGDNFRLFKDEGTGVWMVQLRPQMDSFMVDCDMIVPTAQWHPVSDIYGSLSDDARAEVRETAKTVKRAFELLDNLYALSPTGMYVVRRLEDGTLEPTVDGLDPESTGMLCRTADTNELQAASIPSDLATTSSSRAAVTLARPKQARAGSGDDAAAAAEKRPEEPVAPRRVAEIETFFGNEAIPPPPPAPAVTASASLTDRVSADVSGRQRRTIAQNRAMHISVLAQYIPTFFIPAEEALQHMEGYTVEHLERFFLSSRSLQIVRVEGQAYLRLHGHFGQWDMSDVVTTNERYRHFELPANKVLEIFGKCFPNPGTWHPLSTVVGRVKDDEQFQALPFQGPHALLYFAQAQHMFAFAAQNGGAVARVPAPVQHLAPADSPCPLALDEILRITRANFTDLDRIESLMSQEAVTQLRNAFGSWPDFADAHSSSVVIVNGTVGHMRDYQRLAIKDQSLEDQLEYAYQMGNKLKARTLRRRIAQQRNPDSPLNNPAQLAEAIASFLPPNRPARVKIFMGTAPREVLDFLPKSPLKFFSQFPEHFQMFEWRYPNNHCLLRAGVPLPDGVIRGDYNELSLLAVIVRYMQTRNPCNSGKLVLHIPKAARDIIRKEWGGLTEFLSQYPDNFTIVANHSHDRSDAFSITMVSVPETLLEAGGADAGNVEDNEGDDGGYHE